jgi:hypothetical protein
VDGLDRLGEWAAALLVATTAWLTGLTAEGGDPPMDVGSAAPIVLAWAQDAADSTIQPVEDGDVETLDEGAPPADPEALGQDAQGAVPLDPTGQEDIELLDQGVPPAGAAPLATGAEPVVLVAEPAPAAAPVSEAAPSVVAPATSAPTLPPGFGSGRVHVAAGRAGFPVGLESCHVGAVTGRAYVGIDCDGDDSFVGHAPSFDEFPFVVEAEFPFDNDAEVVPVASAEPDDSTTDIFVSSATGSDEFLVQDPRSPNVTADGEASVTLAQRVRNREPNVRVENQDQRQETERTRSSEKRGRSSVSSQRADDADGEARTESKKKQTAKQREKDGKEQAKSKGKDKNKDRDKKRNKDKKKSDKKRSGHKR